MLKKRLMFTLLYGDGSFFLSRNFRLQRVGDYDWLMRNYDFTKITKSIDELIILNVSKKTNCESFLTVLKKLAQHCFMPIAAGGGVRSRVYARELLRVGADKVVLNTPIFNDPALIKDLSEEFGQQCLVGSIDLGFSNEGMFLPYINQGQIPVNESLQELFIRLEALPIGEVYLNSIDRDGTGNGFNLSMLKALPDNFSKPLIMAGGVGNAGHLLEGILHSRIDAVTTAHLFNFVGDGLAKARSTLLAQGVILPIWDVGIS